MAGIAKISLLGNLGGDPQTRYTPNGKMNVQFSVAVSHRGSDGNDVTSWYRVTAWGWQAEALDKLTQQGALAKGRQVFVAGSLQPREYTNQGGVTRLSLDVNADNVQLAGSRDQNDGGGARPADMGACPF